MSENIEFISASNLPTTEAEEVDVLCVENGELKRKAGATLGGGGGIYRVILTAENCSEEGGVIMCTDDYDELAKALEAGFNVEIHISDGSPLGNPFAMTTKVMLWAIVPDMGLMAAITLVDDNISVLFPNGSYVPQIG